MISMNKTFSLIEAPIYQGQKHFGVSLDPAFIRQILLDRKYKFDCLPVLSSQSQESINSEVYKELSYLVEHELQIGKFPFIVGGDHSLSIGSVQGILRHEPNTKIIWIDAHGDINTRNSSLTKSFHGMPLAFLINEDPFFSKKSWFQNKLSPENLLYLGLRDLDHEEKKFLEKYGISYLTAEQIHNKNINDILNEVIKFSSGHKVHISLDADVFDPSIAYSTGVRVQNGLTYQQVKMFVQTILLVSEVISYEFVELNPQLFISAQDVLNTADLGIKIFKMIMDKLNLKERDYYGFRDGSSKDTESVFDYKSL